MTQYELSKNWFDWCFENTDLIKPSHTALYFFAIEHCNRLGWKEKFGLPTQMAMDAIGIKNWRTYSSTFEELVSFGFFEVFERSKNQYSATVIGIVKNTKANTKALTKAMQKHTQKQCKSIAVIDKQETINNKPLNKYTDADFKKSLIGLGIDEQIAIDWIKVRKSKGAANTQTAFNSIKTQIELSGITANECIRIATEKSWRGFKAEWIKEDTTNNNQFRNKKNGTDYESLYQ